MLPLSPLFIRPFRRVFSRILLACIVALLLLPSIGHEADAAPRFATYTYENTTAGTAASDGCAADTNLLRNFNVTDAFTVDDLNVGFIATNPFRGEIRATLQSPAGTRVQIVRTTADTFDHYDVLLDSASANPLNDGSNDNVAAPFYDRTAAPSFSLDPFNGESAQGVWTLEVCDIGTNGTTAFVRAQLVFEGTPPGVIGVAYRDFDYDGVRDATEVGLANVTVTAYNSSGTVVGTTLTSDSGAYNLNVTGPVRLEFTGQSSAIYPGTAGNSTVQFVNAPATGVDVGFTNPSQYCQANPNICTTLYTAGDPLPTGTGTTGDSPSVITFPYDSTGDGANQLGANARSTGSAWGLAYQRTSNRLFSAAFVKRHVGLGSLGAGGIYVTANPAGTGNATTFMNLAAAPYNVNVGTIGTNSARGLPTNPATPSYDVTAYDLVGKVGFGDLDISTDERVLYVVNLNDRRPYAIVIDADNNPATPPAAADVTALPIPTISPACTNGTFRPFGLKYHEDFLYMGGVCDAASGTSANLEALVFRYNPATPAVAPTQILRFSLNYTKGYVITSSAAPGCQDGPEDRNWQPWRATFPTGCSPSGRTIIYPQPMLSGIEFDVDGSLILDFMDRSGHQIGYLNYSTNTASTVTYVNMTGGEILRAYPSGSGFALENNASTNQIATSGTNNAQGIGGGEYYYGDFFSGTDSSGAVSHNEIAQGGIVVLPGSNEVVSTAFDPDDQVNSGGVIWLSNPTGRKTDGYEIYVTATAPGTFAKANGTSDLELLCNAAPIEIGNRIWRDTDGDGVQDADESGLTGVTVQLYSGATLIGTAVTDLKGNFLFSSDATRTDRLGADYGITQMVAGAVLQLRVVPSAAQNTNALSGLALTTADANSGTNSDLRDSDATISGGNAIINVTLGLAGQNNHTFDIGYAPLGKIGNRVWLDEDSNGIQDEGELGVPNAIVQLKNSAGTVIATTATGPGGNYIFRDLPAGQYFVQVLASSIPTGMTQTTLFPIPGADKYNQNQSGTGYSINLKTGDENLSADFGYNWNPTDDVNNGTGTAALGNCVWVDADGNGKREWNEIGISGVSVQLITAGPDNIFYTSDDVVASTTTTDVNGCYIFDGLTAGAYVVRIPNPPSGYTQTGDPDHYNSATGVNDNQTTVPIILSPGDVFLNADFGYQPAAGTFGSIGNVVWYDLDGDGCGPNNLNSDITNGNCPLSADNSEFGIPGVIIYLIRDTNANGTWDSGEPILASTVTDAKGLYLFNGLPIADGTGTDDYLVYVADAWNALEGLTPSYDQNGIGTPNISSVLNLSPTAVTNQDFGYSFDNSGQAGAATTTLPLPAIVENQGQIGNRVWLDANSNGAQDAGEFGMEGVRVNLFCRGLDGISGTADDIYQSTITGAEGIYLFTDLPVNLSGNICTVTVVTSTLPGTMTQTFDGDGTGTPHSSTVTITTLAPVNLNQDFGYVGPGSIGNLVWRDTNGDGINNGVNGPDGLPGTEDDEPGLGGVTLLLYYDSNANGILDETDRLLGFQNTDPNGAYLFAGLPVNNGSGSARYIINVLDNRSSIVGLFHSLGAAGTNNNSQNDPYPVTLTPAAPNNLTADFGYYYSPASVGNRVWIDTNNNGLQDTGEPSVAGINVTLTIVYPNGAGTIVMNTVTNSAGYYRFENLLLDEDYDAVGANEPVFTISVAGGQNGLTGFIPAIVDVSSNSQDLRDSDNHAGVVAVPIQGLGTIPMVSTDPATERAIASYDFGYVVPGVIGNRIWIDEDSNGVQDEGEDGIPNITVNLYNSAGTIVGTAITNANGDYIFRNVPPGNYFVQVLNSTIPSGMTQTTIYPANGADLVNQDQSTGPGDFGYPVTLAAGQSNLTADFGYNWNPTADVNSPGANTTAALGDRVWVDVNGNGRQEPDELGIQGATLQLITPGADTVFGTADDVLGATTTTNATGFYIFDNLAPGVYGVQVVSLPAGFTGYTQTGDPDHYATTGANDARTTLPVVLGPGDVFLNVDFGYQPGAGITGSIGDTIWLDLNANGIGPANTPGGGDTTEPYISGVTVSLIRDLNQNGVRDAGEPIIATDITDANGFYLFAGLPITDGTGTDDYLVFVDDATYRLQGLTPTYDQNGIATPNISSVLNLAATPVLTQDFGYTYDNTPTGGSNSTTLPLPGLAEQPGRLGDRVWLDLNSNGVQEANEPGLIGVTVTLTSNGPDGLPNTADDINQSVVTGANGAYLFDNLPVSASGILYNVTVATASLPGTLTQTFDANGTGTPNTSSVSLTTGTPSVVNQDFGYVGTGIVGNLVWHDVNGNGQVDAGEPGFSNVTLALYWDSNVNGILDSADRFINTATTDANGGYTFTGLSLNDGGNNIQYIVDVVDANGILAGYHHTIGAPNTNNHSQNDNGYVAQLTTTSTSNLTADFGYMQQIAAVGNRVWRDSNNNGLQDTGEPGIPNVIVRLVIVYPGGATITMGALTNGEGYYAFSNLLQDEDYNGGTADTEPVFTISVVGSQANLSGFTPAIVDVSSNSQDLRDSDNHAGVTAVPQEGQTAVPLIFTDPTTEAVIASYDFGYVVAGTVGNRIWIDEDSNGVQDEGEDGIPNITVNLYNSAGTIIATTVTNANGEYLFRNVPPGNYFVRVDNSTIPTGMTQTTTYPANGADLVNQDQSTGPGDFGYPVTVTSGQSNLTADFGYNWNPTGDVTTPGAATTAALGDRVWVDSDGDGIQDPEESGIQGATLQIIRPGADNVFGTSDDVPGATTTTNATGYYIFDDLAPGQYMVQVVSLPAGFGAYVQTGDPDHFGTTGPNDARTTYAIILGPGDVFLNVDFGYQPPAGAVGSIGDTIWLDLNANGIGPANTPGGGDTTEPYISGVTVSLIRDLNQNGVWNVGEPIIATTVTNANGFYLFPGLVVTDGTGTDDYLVVVDDVNNRLQGLAATYDANGIGTPNISAVPDLTVTAVLTQDFGYTYDSTATGGSNTTTIPAALALPGRIGDRVWLDLNSNGVQDANEPGLVGVTVTLTSNGPDGVPGGGDDINQSVVTGANGIYLFNNLPVSASGILYNVSVTIGTLPGALTQTFDANGTGTPNTSTATLTTGTPTVLTQDFGYVGTGTVGNLVWNDINGDGDVDAGEPGFSGVTVAIYWDSNVNGVLDPADRLINTTTTDANGGYTFTGLSLNDGGNNIQYIVDVTDTNGVLVGYNHTIGIANTNNNSQNDNGYVAQLTTTSTSNLTADFGYQQQVAAVGNRVFNDDNNNGLQDTNEPGISGVIVRMVITYPGGGTVTVATLTNDIGYYSFTNLLLDENYNGDGVGSEPSFVISVNTGQTNLIGYNTAIVDVSGNSQDLRDSDNHAGVTAVPVEGQSNVPLVATDPVTEAVIASYDFGFVSTLDYGDLPTAFSNIKLANNGARHVTGAIRLGALVDTDGEGTPTSLANGDDVLDLSDDEDGVIKTPGSIWTPGGTGSLNVTVSGGTGFVTVWIDWNRNNNFNDTGERVFVDQSITNSTQVVTFPVPAGTTFPAGQVFNLRARVYSATTNGGASPIGLAAGIGEVEDHQLDSAALEVQIDYFEAECRPSDIMLRWETVSETDILGFNLLRNTDPDGLGVPVNEELIPSTSPGGGQGGVYEFPDETVVEGNTYYYWLEAVDLGGATTQFLPIRVAYPCAAPTAVSLSTLGATASPAPWGMWVALMVVAAGVVILKRK